MNHTQRAKQQKSNLDKLDKILASLPEAQYDHSEEESSSKKRGRPKKNSESSKKTIIGKKTAHKKEVKKETPKKEAPKKESQNAEKKNSGWGWNKKKRGRPSSASKNPPLKIIPLGGLGEIGKNLTV